METKFIEIDEKQLQKSRIEEVAEALRQNKLVAFPTETVYGIGANALSVEAANNIYKAKGRPSDNPLIVHLACWEQLPDYVQDIGEKAAKLAERFWPGPLTMVFKKKENIPSEITAGLDTVGIRIPKHPVAHAILKECQLPIAAPSANLSGKPSPTEFHHVREDLQGRVDIIVHSGASEVGLESTVVDMTQEVPVILRPGGISMESIVEVIGEVRMNRSTLGDKEIPVAPGMKYRHYAPEGKLHLLPPASFEENVEELLRQMTEAKKQGKKTAALVASEYLPKLEEFLCFNLGSEHNLEEIARHLFDGLRFMDEQKVEEIFAISYEKTGIGEAIMNRLQKAAGQKNIDKKGNL